MFVRQKRAIADKNLKCRARLWIGKGKTLSKQSTARRDPYVYLLTEKKNMYIRTDRIDQQTIILTAPTVMFRECLLRTGAF